MSKRVYPYYAGKIKGKQWPPTITCTACNNPATCYVDIQFSWFRSDDEAYRVCDLHVELARHNLGLFLDQMFEFKKKFNGGTNGEATHTRK
jgi:hypothetical protein